MQERIFILKAKSFIPVIFLITTLLFTQCHTKSPSDEKLEDNFMNPPIYSRPMAYWPWLNGFVDTSKLVYELKQMKDKGMRGALIWDVGALADRDRMIPAGPAFLGKESLEYISLAMKTGKKLGLDLGLVISSSWNAGGPWVDKADASQKLVSTSQIIKGPSKSKIVIKAPETGQGETKPYSLITSLAFPSGNNKVIDLRMNKTVLLDKFTSENKFIDWDVPEGSWEVMSFFMCNTGQKLECPSPKSDGLIIDHLSRQATRNNIDTVLARLEKISTPANHLKFLEDDSYEVWEAKDWTPGFLQEFKTRYKYDAVPFLPLLQGYSIKDSILAERFRGDYNRLISDMIIENHFIQSTKIAGEKGMQIFVEAGHGGSPRVEPLKALGNTDIPMGEFWNRQQFWVTKEAASAAHIYGKKIVAAESLTGWQNWQQGPTDFKQLIDIAFCEGLNQVVFHNFAHNPEIAGKPGFVYHAGEHINVNTTWWEMARPFMDYISRCSYLLRQGNFVGDVCMYYGDQAPNLVPPDRIDPNITPLYDDNHCLHCGQLKPVNPGKLPGYDYDYMDGEIIATSMNVKNGNLVLPSGQTYRLMLIPDRDDISLDILKKLDTLAYKGAIIVGRKPQRTTTLKDYPQCDTVIRNIADKMWGKCDGKTILSNKYGKGTIYWGKTVKQILDELHIPPDMEVFGIDNSDEHIDYLHRQTETQEIYFVSNSKPEEEKISCVFRVDKNMIPELWDAGTGLIQREVNYSTDKNGIRIDFGMEPLSSRFVVFSKKSKGKNDVGLCYDLQYGFNHNQRTVEKNKSIDLSNNWNVSFNPEMGGPATYHLDRLVSWPDITEEGIKYYSGTATYQKNFTIDKNALTKGTDAFVVFEDIKEMAQVHVNGNDCGIIWMPPYKTDITKYLKAGSNNITVKVVNTWNNRIVGDVRNPDKKQYTMTNIKYKFKADSPLLKSGISGKAEIIFRNKYE